MNVELAERALRVAKANPEKFDMDSWVDGMYDDPVVKEAPEFVPPCGTTACFAGWVAFQAAPVGSQVIGSTVTVPGQGNVHVETYAIRALDISYDQAQALFFLDGIEQVEDAVKFLADNPDAGQDAIRQAAGQFVDDL